MAAADHLGGQFTPYITPERRRAVEAAMPPVYVGNSPNEAKTARTTPDNPHGAAGKAALGRMYAQHRLARTIMKSDVPVEHLKGIQRITVGKTALYRNGTRAVTHTYTGDAKNGGNQFADLRGKSSIDFASNFGSGPTVKREFASPETASALARYHAMDPNPVSPRSHAERDMRQRDVVHEIGHHNDPQIIDPYVSAGTKEASAENYADTYIGRTKTFVAATYDDPANDSLTPLQKASYKRRRRDPESLGP